jgi:hypothetical protein
MKTLGTAASAFAIFSVLLSGAAQAHFTTDDSDARFYTVLHFMPHDPPIAGEPSDVYVSIYNATTGDPIVDLDTVHERVLHIFVVGADGTFAHIHPEDRANGTEFAVQGVYVANHTFPTEGRYAVVADFTYKGETLVKKFELYAFANESSSYVRTGESGQADFSTRKQVGGYEVDLVLPDRIEVGREAEMSLHIEDADGLVRDLQQLLGSEAHFLFLRDDLKYPAHTHAYRPGHSLHFGRMAQVYYGPDVPVRQTFQYPGTYMVFAQFMRGGDVVTAKFLVKVEESTYSAALLYGSYAAIALFAVVLFRREILRLLVRRGKKNPGK